MLTKSVGLIHIVLSFIFSIYFVWAPASLDYYYLLYFIILNISWSLLNNECAFSYLFKVLKNPEYKMGSTEDVEDYKAVLGDKNSILFLNYILFMYIFNLLFIANRFPGLRNKLFLLLLAGAYVIYIRMLRSIEGEQKKILQESHAFINTIILGYFVLNK